MELKSMNTLTVEQAAYLAGIIDGEGCIAVSRTVTGPAAKGCKRGIAYRSSVGVAMTDLRVLAWLYTVTGVGNINIKARQNPAHKEAYAWYAWSKEASEVIKAALPYLIVKREQAENQIAFQETMRIAGTTGLSDEEWDLRERFYLESRRLNRRGAPENER
jgi:hypothetical protein